MSPYSHKSFLVATSILTHTCTLYLQWLNTCLNVLGCRNCIHKYGHVVKNKIQKAWKNILRKDVVLPSSVTGKAIFHYLIGQRYINQKQIVEMRASVIHTKKKRNKTIAVIFNASGQIGTFYTANCNIPPRVNTLMKATTSSHVCLFISPLSSQE